MAIKYREGGAEIEIAGDLERIAIEAVDRALPGVRKLMEAELNDIYATAVAEWPVKTGNSRRGLKKSLVIAEDALIIKIDNAVPYAVYVRPKAWFGTTTAWQRLVRGPMHEASKETARRVGSSIIQSIKSAGG